MSIAVVVNVKYNVLLQ